MECEINTHKMNDAFELTGSWWGYTIKIAMNNTQFSWQRLLTKLFLHSTFIFSKSLMQLCIQHNALNHIYNSHKAILLLVKISMCMAITSHNTSQFIRII